MTYVLNDPKAQMKVVVLARVLENADADAGLIGASFKNMTDVGATWINVQACLNACDDDGK